MTKTEEALVRETEPTPERPGDASGRASRKGLKPQGGGYGLKRAILGPAIPTHRLLHERLGKVTALSIFSSDALSSVAYATEEMLRVFVAAGVGAAMFALVLPVSAAIVVVLVTLVFSYRQTIKAYPSAGGAYIVTKDNFGLLPAQVAGVALLTDYVLTVAVSISAGVAAIVSVYAGLFAFRVPIALGFLVILVWGNLRGVKESGRLFAAPTYLFILSIFAMLGVAAVRLAAGSMQALPHADLPTAPVNGGLLMGISTFVVLKALASGSTAMTGVEAISNGVPAFRPPEWLNARRTLEVMGAILGTMFLGVSYLAHRLQVVPDPAERRTVVSMIARAAFGGGAIGHAAFFVLQVATMAVLVLAANTSFADFPRLANFHAGDAFMPRQFTSRGHRLVFSNGIIALGIAAGALIVAFQANVTRLIPFYAIGVFTSFTMSQAGMAKRHLRLKEPGWRHGFAINAFGALATGVVDIVIAVTKFPADTAILILVPVMVWFLVRMNVRYEHERQELDESLVRFDRTEVRRPITVLLIDDLDRETLHALQYAKTIHSEATHAVHFTTDAESAGPLTKQWQTLGVDGHLEIVTHDGDLPSSLAWYVGALPQDADVNVVMAGPADPGLLDRLRRARLVGRLTHALRACGRARITLVRDHLGPGYALTETAEGGQRLRLVPRLTHQVVVLVEKADRATMEAVRYALSLGTEDVRAVHAALDETNQIKLIDAWMTLGMPIDLDVIECWDRNVPRALERYVAERMGPRTEVTVVMPRRDFAQLRSRVLHDRTSRRISRALGRYEHVDLAVVPFFLREPSRTVPAAPDQAVDAGSASAKLPDR